MREWRAHEHSIVPGALSRPFAVACSHGSARTAAICPGALTAATKPGAPAAIHTASGSRKSCSSRRASPPSCPTTIASSTNFPTVESLARAPQDEVLKLWSGLGYYSRARNLHRAAKEIVARHNGNFPRALDAALALPGIGRYTAAAVLSIAYDVLRSPSSTATWPASSRGSARFAAISARRAGGAGFPKWRRTSSRGAPAAIGTRRLMELGETICTPQIPRCPACPVSRWCRARARGLTREIPAPRKKRAPVRMQIAAAILRDPRGRTLLVRDPGAHDDVLFSRMWQFPAVEVARCAEDELAAHLAQSLEMDTASLDLQALPRARHGVTFRNITLLPFLARVARLPKRARTRVIPLDRLLDLAVSSATRKIAAAFARP